jgi:hypothetical protein
MRSFNLAVEILLLVTANLFCAVPGIQNTELSSAGQEKNITICDSDCHWLVVILFPFPRQFKRQSKFGGEICASIVRTALLRCPASQG